MIVPIKVVFANNKVDHIILPLPVSENHLTNSSLNIDDQLRRQLPNGVSNVKYQRFYKNGKIVGPDDLCVVTFEYENETIIIQFKFSELCDKGYLNCEKQGKLGNAIFSLI